LRDYYIFKSGRLRRNENTVEFEDFKGEKRPLPINDLYSIHLFGEIDLNTKVIVFMNQYGIPLHFYNYYGYYSGSFYPKEKHVSGFLVVKQVQYYLDLQKRLSIAKEFVNSAIHNILANLEHYEKNGKAVASFLNKIREEYASLDSVSTIAALMGIEGRSRDIYYSSFSSFLREGFEFDRRTKMPPQNMLNCLISFGNSLLYATILTEIYHTQLTPTVSYLHEPGERRYSLALDISEVFKPIIVDRVIFNLINNRIIKEEHFLEELNFCYLKEQGRR
jgi:CRISP-associated protein Cas1